MFVGPEAIGLSRRNSGLVVESLGGAGRELVAGQEPVEELASMLAQGAGELLEGLQARAQCHGGPALEEPLGPVGRPVGPEVLELLLEEIGADGAQVDRNQVPEPSPFGTAE